MRYIDILDEATAENIKVVRELADIVAAAMPDTPRGSNTKLYMSQVQNFDNLYKKYEDNEKFKKAFQFMETTEIQFINDPAYIDKYYENEIDKYGGYFSKVDNLILVVLFNRREIGIYETVKNTLIHEFRHLFQHAEYAKYFDSAAAYKKPYEERHIELDATWSDLVGSDTPEGMQGAETEYADSIMARMTSIKRLNPKLLDHYRKKTIKYAKEFFMHNIDLKIKRLLKQYNKIDVSMYSMPQWLTDLQGDIYYIYEYELGRLLTPREDSYYKQFLRKWFMDHSVESRTKKRTADVQSKLFPAWSREVSNNSEDVRDPAVSKITAASKIVDGMDKDIRAMSRTTDEYKDLVDYFNKYSMERIDVSRSWAAKK